MSEFRYVIDAVPPSNNEYIGQNKAFDYNKAKREWAEIVAVYCRPVPQSPIARARVSLIYHFPDKIRRDPDNYSGKFILDGLTHAGIIQDDNFNVIELRILAGAVSKNPYTEVIVEDKTVKSVKCGNENEKRFIVIQNDKVLYYGSEEAFRNSDDERLVSFRERFTKMKLVNSFSQADETILFVK